MAEETNVGPMLVKPIIFNIWSSCGRRTGNVLPVMHGEQTHGDSWRHASWLSWLLSEEATYHSRLSYMRPRCLGIIEANVWHCTDHCRGSTMYGHVWPPMTRVWSLCYYMHGQRGVIAVSYWPNIGQIRDRLLCSLGAALRMPKKLATCFVLFEVVFHAVMKTFFYIQSETFISSLSVGSDDTSDSARLELIYCHRQ